MNNCSNGRGGGKEIENDSTPLGRIERGRKKHTRIEENDQL